MGYLKKMFWKIFGKIGYLLVNNINMKKVKLTESDLTRIIKRVINEQSMDKPTDEQSLHTFLSRHTNLSNEEKRFMSIVFQHIQDGKVEKGKGVYDFNKKYPDAVVPASLILNLL